MSKERILLGIAAVFVCAGAGFCFAVPVIVVEPGELNFTAVEGGDNPAAQILYISNGGTGQLDWEINEDCEWLSVEPVNGSCVDETDEVIVDVNSIGLSIGEYSYELTITDPDASNSPQVVQVSLTIIEAKLNVLPDEGFESSGFVGGPFTPGSKEYTLTNVGEELLYWGISWESDWLDVSDGFGSLDPNESVIVMVYLTAEADELGEGDYYDTLKFTNLDTMVEQTRSVHLSIAEGNVLLVPDKYPTIQAAIDAANDVDTVIVDVGTYVENINFGGKNITLTSTKPEDPNVVKLTVIDGNEGGSVVTFAGIETSDCVLTGFTITNGTGNKPAGTDDRFGGGIYGNGTEATISNCIITANEVKAIYEARGGGLYGCNGTITNCIISGNTADDDGGGLYDCDGTISNCIISGNKARLEGGGLYDCDGTIKNCTITGNTGDYSGGLDDCDGEINNCIISNNSDGLENCDGEISNCIISNNNSSGLNYCSAKISNCTIADNDGSGLRYCNNVEISNCTITGNTTRYDGGGLAYCYGTISNCTISGNRAHEGSGLYCCGGTISNCIISNNTSTYRGCFYKYKGTISNCTITGNFCVTGVLYECGGTIINCTIAGNFGYYGVLYDCYGTVTNCIILSGRAFPYCTANITYCCYQDASGNGNIDVDPLFVDTSSSDPNFWDYHLLPESPCIDMGDPYFVPEEGETDIDGEPRVMGGRIDMGADEVPVYEPHIGVSAYKVVFKATEDGANPEDQILMIHNSGVGVLEWQITEDCDWLTVNPESGESEGEPNEVILGAGITDLVSGDYSCELIITDAGAANSPVLVTIILLIRPEDGVLLVPDAFGTIQLGIDAAVDSDTVIVDVGTYIENINFGGKNIILTSTNPEDMGIVTATVIDGGGIRSVVTFSGTETEECVLTGFTITGGGATSSGGGIHGNQTEATISNCTISGNTATYEGGGLYNCDGDVINCTISGNKADYGGGLAYCDGMILDCTISDNTAYGDGGGLVYCDGTISNCTISGNTADGYGGGSYACKGAIINCTIVSNTAYSGGGLASSHGTIANCIISGNTVDNTGGGLYGCDRTISNCIISGNTAKYYGGGLYGCYGPINNCTIVGNMVKDNVGGGFYLRYGDLTITNCISRGNEPDEIFLYDSTAVVTYTNIEGGWSGAGNIDENPLFVDFSSQNPSKWDLHLQTWSPCVDAGDPAFVPETGEVDIDGEPRVMGGRVDMGADEVGEKQADFTRDGRIDVSDLAVLGGAWGTQEGELNWYVLSDLFEDGVIGLDDLVLFVEDWMWHADWY